MAKKSKKYQKLYEEAVARERYAAETHRIVQSLSEGEHPAERVLDYSSWWHGLAKIRIVGGWALYEHARPTRGNTTIKLTRRGLVTRYVSPDTMLEIIPESWYCGGCWNKYSLLEHKFGECPNEDCPGKKRVVIEEQPWPGLGYR